MSTLRKSSQTPIDAARILFTIEQRVIIGTVIESEYDNDRHPVAIAFDIISNRMVESAENGDDCSFEFTYEGVKRTVSLAHGE